MLNGRAQQEPWPNNTMLQAVPKHWQDELVCLYEQDSSV
jgi:hypothetical protein